MVLSDFGNFFDLNYFDISGQVRNNVVVSSDE